MTMDPSFPAMCTRMYFCRASLSATSMTHALVMAAAKIALSRLRSFHWCRDACLFGSENSSEVVAPDVISVASKLLYPVFFSFEELLLLWLLLLLLESVLRDLRCQRGHCSILFCHVAGLGALCCCCGNSGCSERAVINKRSHCFRAHLSQRVCVGIIVL